MPDDELKWRRRKKARPGEIIGAALEVFAAKGFADAKLDDIARRAGISKGTLYLTFSAPLRDPRSHRTWKRSKARPGPLIGPSPSSRPCSYRARPR